MGARSQMTMRVDIDADNQTATDPYGEDTPPLWELAYDDQPCYAWTNSREEAVDNDFTVVLEELRVMLPKSVGISERYRLNSIRDRANIVLFEGPFNIRSVEWKRDHWECALERVK
jgi:hypothetical protein